MTQNTDDVEYQTLMEKRTLESPHIEFPKEIALPVSNRLIAYHKSIKIYFLIILLPSFICLDNPTSFNVIFASIFFILPIIPIYFYLRRNNVQQCLLKMQGIELIVNKQKTFIEFSKIGIVKQLISTELSLLPRIQNIYEIQLLEKYKFGNKIFLKLDANTNPTKEHDLITEFKHRQKIGIHKN